MTTCQLHSRIYIQKQNPKYSPKPSRQNTRNYRSHAIHKAPQSMVHRLYSGWLYPRRRWERKRWPLLLAQVQHQVLLRGRGSQVRTKKRGRRGSETETSLRRRAEGGRRAREREQLARLQSKIRRAIRWGCAGGREGRKVTRAQTPTKSIEDSTRHRSGVPDRASSSVTVCSSWQRTSVFIQGATSHVHLLCPPKTKSKSNAQSSANAATVRCERPVNRPSRTTFRVRELPADQRGTAFPRSRNPIRFSPVNRAVALLFSSKCSGKFRRSTVTV